MQEAIRLKNISKAFQNKTLYEKINLQISQGECVGFAGGNGVGKSVLFQIMVGLLSPDQGEVYVNGIQLGKGQNEFPKGVGILINEVGYIEYYSGYQNLQMLAQIQNIIGKEQIQRTMELVGLDYSDRTPVKKYSMGMRQKLGIAQAIMENQTIILLDEPYNALDFKTNKEITKLLKLLKQQGKTILLTSHQHNYLEMLCDSIYYIGNNCIKAFDETVKKQYFDME